jgi:hypothetical protein
MKSIFNAPAPSSAPTSGNPDKRVDPKTLPTSGQILAEMSGNRVGGEEYDRAWPERARQTLW